MGPDEAQLLSRRCVVTIFVGGVGIVDSRGYLGRVTPSVDRVESSISAVYPEFPALSSTAYPLLRPIFLFVLLKKGSRPLLSGG